MRCAIVEQFARCFDDHRLAGRVEHEVRDLLAQRVFALALGYGDRKDHDELRLDPLLMGVIGKADPKGAKRVSSPLKNVELARPPGDPRT